jgi:putative peptidoglycan lipid II flippase
VSRIDAAGAPRVPQTVGAGLIASAAMIAAITVVARVVGFGRWVVFSGNVGATCIGAAYTSANLLPNVLFEVAAGGALAGAVVPLLAGPISRAAAGRPDVDRIASAVISWTLLVLVPVSLLLAAFAGPLSRLLIHEACPGQRALTARMIMVFAPQIALYGIGVVLSGVLAAHRRFFWPAAAPLLSSLVVIGAYLAFGATDAGARTAARLPGAAENWLAWGTTAGVVVMTVPLLVPVHRAGIRLRPSLHFPPGVARRGLALAAAGIGALLAQQASLFVVLLLANHSGQQGAFPVFQYAQAVYLLPYAVLAVPLATSAFPRLAERANLGDRAGFAITASITTRAVVVVALFGAAVLAGAAVPVGRFFAAIDQSRAAVAGGALSSLGTALTVLAPGLLGFALIAHIARALYALEYGRAAATATATGWLAVIVGSVLGARSDHVVVGLAWGNTVGMTVAGGLLLLTLRRSAGPEALAGLPRVLIAGTMAAVVAAIAGRLVAVQIVDATATGVAGSVLAGVLAGLVSSAVFVVLLALLDRPDLATVIERARPSARAQRIDNS